jgi:hypothetical protein
LLYRHSYFASFHPPNDETYLSQISFGSRGPAPQQVGTNDVAPLFLATLGAIGCKQHELGQTGAIGP